MFDLVAVFIVIVLLGAVVVFGFVFWILFVYCSVGYCFVGFNLGLFCSLCLCLMVVWFGLFDCWILSLFVMFYVILVLLFFVFWVGV